MLLAFYVAFLGEFSIFLLGSWVVYGIEFLD